ncbi:ATP-binding cassette domain-containing protein [Macrococcus equipercicus]|uniref:ATP-binding cassette domain-containing protein n=1 Tax=Macrococcus equipercicus TaxID=69967 RepID=A0ABQ6RAV2_9STAP|nr:ATP-binding cassette domain-containing protein [Macrococcus equipercicus]KAA1042369.1 ATP-binding cassette domain-containing protein [Macrococcus equipercicus]
MAIIEIEHVTKQFQTKKGVVEALRDVSLTIEKGQIFGIVGYSGAGKSTLVRLINKLEKPTSGRVVIEGEDITRLSQKLLRRRRQNIGMIFQQFNLFRAKTVEDNIKYPLKLTKKYSKAEIDKRVDELLQFVGLQDKKHDYPSQLSGGQKQRIGIARALATNPDILLCDEATSALDPETTDEILRLLKRINDELNITIVMITHEMEVVKSICDEVAVMEKGRIVEQNQVFELFTNPVHPTTKRFVHSVLNDDIPGEVDVRARKIYRFIFNHQQILRPVLSQVGRQFNVDFNILYGGITELTDKLFGNLLIEAVGSDSSIYAALDSLLSHGIQIKEVNGFEN